MNTPKDPNGPPPEAGEPTPDEAVPSIGPPEKPAIASGEASPDTSSSSRSAEELSDLDESDRELGGRMTFLEHLDEFRRRILYSLGAVLIAFVAAWGFFDPIYTFLSAPIRQVTGNELYVTKPTEGFSIHLKVAFAAAIFVAVPYIFFQIWLFIAPGLYRREKVYVIPFLVSSTALFVAGTAFAYYVILMPALDFLLNDMAEGFNKIITVSEFYDFELVVLLGMGAIFQLPVLVAFLSLFGLVTPGFLWRNFRYAFLLMLIVAAIVSPTTDAVNLFLWCGPMVILYLLSIGVSWVFKRRRQKRNEWAD